MYKPILGACNTFLIYPTGSLWVFKFTWDLYQILSINGRSRYKYFLVKMLSLLNVIGITVPKVLTS